MGSDELKIMDLGSQRWLQFQIDCFCEFQKRTWSMGLSRILMDLCEYNYQLHSILGVQFKLCNNAKFIWGKLEFIWQTNGLIYGFQSVVSIPDGFWQWMARAWGWVQACGRVNDSKCYWAPRWELLPWWTIVQVPASIIVISINPKIGITECLKVLGHDLGQHLLAEEHVHQGLERRLQRGGRQQGGEVDGGEGGQCDQV